LAETGELNWQAHKLIKVQGYIIPNKVNSAGDSTPRDGNIWMQLIQNFHGLIVVQASRVLDTAGGRRHIFCWWFLVRATTPNIMHVHWCRNGLPLAEVSWRSKLGQSLKSKFENRRLDREKKTAETMSMNFSLLV
jgi:hypothetical protein